MQRYRRIGIHDARSQILLVKVNSEKAVKRYDVAAELTQVDSTVETYPAFCVPKSSVTTEDSVGFDSPRDMSQARRSGTDRLDSRGD